MIRRAAILLIATIGAAAASAQQPRDAPRTTGTASISGTVLVDGDPRQPARRTRVTLTDVARVVTGQTTTTDHRGQFVFRGLPAGRYDLQAFKNAYLRASYGAARPNRAGTPVVVAEGEAVSGLTIAIARGGVITGTVRDARDRPVPGTSLRVLRLGYNALTGERTLGATGGGSVTATDDRGEYRAYGLPPGNYLVLVPGPTPGRGNEPMRRLTSDEVRQAMQAARSGTAAAPGAPPISVASASARFNYAPVFHPGVTDITTASIVPLALGQERTGIDITIQLVPTATVSGTITSPAGALPPTLSVRLVPAGAQSELLAGAGLPAASTQVQPGGRYAFPGVAPGSYVVRATVGYGGRGGVPQTGPIQWASADVYLAGEDVVVPLALQAGVPVSGRVLFKGDQPTPAELESLSFMLMAPGSGGQLQSFGGGRVDREGRFTFAHVVPDAYRFAVTWGAPSARDRWVMESSVANGREAFDAPLRVNPNEPVEWTVTFTDTPSVLTGTLVNPGGRAATEYYILVFPADRAHWTPGSRRIRMTRPATDGRFTVRGLPAGDYFLAAPLDLEDGEWNDPALLEQLAAAAVRVTIREGETTTQNYRMGG